MEQVHKGCVYSTKFHSPDCRAHRDRRLFSQHFEEKFLIENIFVCINADKVIQWNFMQTQIHFAVVLIAELMGGILICTKKNTRELICT